MSPPGFFVGQLPPCPARPGGRGHSCRPTPSRSAHRSAPTAVMPERIRQACRSGDESAPTWPMGSGARRQHASLPLRLPSTACLSQTQPAAGRAFGRDAPGGRGTAPLLPTGRRPPRKPEPSALRGPDAQSKCFRDLSNRTSAPASAENLGPAPRLKILKKSSTWSVHRRQRHVASQQHNLRKAEWGGGTNLIQLPAMVPNF